MRISIIPQDNRIIVDGKTVDLDDNDIRWTFDDEHIHAIQWKNSKGEIEYEDEIGEKPLPNKIFGEDEFDAIIQPYLNFFNTFFSEFEKKYSEDKIVDEKRQLDEIEELNISKMQQEENILLVENLQEQNRQVRDEYKKLADELEKVLEEKALSDQYSRLDESKRVLEKEEEIKTLELKKLDEYMQERSNKFVERLDDLYKDLEDQRNEFVEEKKQWNEYIQKYKNSLEDEVKQIEETYNEDIKSREIRDQLSEKMRIVEEEEINLIKQNLEMERLSLEQQLDEKHQERLLHGKEMRNRLDSLELEAQRIEDMKQQFEERMRIREEPILMHEDLQDNMAALHDSIEKEIEIEENNPKTIAKVFDVNQMFNDEFVKNKMELRDISDKSIDEINAIELGDQNIGSIIDFIDQIDPENFYNIVTDSERRTNSFPVGKAAIWFNQLKDLLNKERLKSDYELPQEEDDDEEDEE